MTETPLAPLPSPAGAPAQPVLILGGGISGLALAAWLREAGQRALVLEESAAAGGVIESAAQDGFTFDLGPNTVLEKFDSFARLLEIAGLAGEAARAPVRDHARYIWRAGRLHEVPTGPGAFLSSRLLSARGKLRALGEFWVKPEHGDEDLKTFVVRRLGTEVYERAFLPMVQGIWAGDPAKMSVEAAFPMLKELERASGGLLRGMLFPAQRAGGGAPKRRPAQMVSVNGGLARLPAALARGLGDALRTGVSVKQIMKASSGYEVLAEENGALVRFLTRRVVVCAPAPAAAAWIGPLAPQLAERLREVSYCALAVAGLGVPAGSLRIPPGFGFLAARGEGLRILGAIFNSNFMPGRAPEGHAALTVMIGGELDPAGASFSDEAIAGLLRADLGRALAWDGRVSALRIKRWPAAIPRYGLDHGALSAAAAAAERAQPGLHFFANWRGGVSLADRIELAQTLARALTAEASSASARDERTLRAC